MSETTKIKELRHGNWNFSWGKIIRIEEIGIAGDVNFSIVVFHPWKTKGCTVETGRPDYDKIYFHGYVNDEDTHESYLSLEEALVGCVAYKREGFNHRADRYFFKMIQENLPTGEKK